ncbi:MAG: aminotransferase class I/II-fold pyridoxal phosphate-dependent enzyme [Alphaproteobacteria bacterium]
MSNESLDRFAKSKLDRLTAHGLRRSVVDTHRTDAVHIRRGGRDLVSFCCNDYLGLTHHPAVKEAAAAAIADHGAGAGASRLITGNHPLYAVLERKLAALKGTEAACVFGSGYMANAGILPALAGPDDLIVIDALGHASMHMGARAARANILTFRHNDASDLADILARERASAGTCLVVTEGVFSMDGDRAPLNDLAAVCAGHDAWLMVDDAHGFGVLGGGRGSAFEFDPVPDILLQMGTLSKAAGVYGAFLCASAPVIDLMKNRARSLVYTTGLPPSVVAAAIAAVDIIATEADRVARPLERARAFCEAVGLHAPESPIVPMIVASEAAALGASAALEEAGFLVTPIRPPTVPAGTSRLRFTFTAEHTAAQVAALADAVNALDLVRETTPRAAEG